MHIISFIKKICHNAQSHECKILTLRLAVTFTFRSLCHWDVAHISENR